MRMLCGYLEPCSGTISIGGLALADNARSVQRELGYLPENLPVYPDMMVADYLEYAATLKGIARDSDSRRCARPLSPPTWANARSIRWRLCHAASGSGWVIAQAILGKPRLLIIDEPTNGLDRSRPNTCGA